MDLMTKIRGFLPESFSICKWFAPKEIRLAVVGCASSGKSFLLRDIIDAFGSMNCSYYESPSQKARYGFTPTSFDNYAPNQQQGSTGKTDRYACRQENHYGGRIKCTDKFDFDLSFLNIPGEIFHDEKSLKCYSELRNQLRSNNKLFAVHTYKQPSGGIKLIVTPHDGFTDDEKGVAVQRDTSMLFENWAQIEARLQKGSFKDSKKVKKISGKYLLEHFFKYDTDSVVSSIGALIYRNAIPGLSFEYTDFDENRYGISFVFFHYCTLATDIIVCDRIYSHVPKDKETMAFNVLTGKLNGFLNQERKAQDVNVYMALRNVDFMLNKMNIEVSYQDLYEQLSQYPSLVPRNAIYSLFSYLLFRHVGYNMGPMKNDIRHILGLRNETVKLLDDGWPGGGSTDDNYYSVDDTKLQQLSMKYLDVSGGNGHVLDAKDMEQHIKSRIGGAGQGFKQLLTKTGNNPNRGHREVTPHVYFSCTPITEQFEVYKNGVASKNPDPLDFYRDGDPVPFSSAGSRFCFGSFQLCLDLLYQHGITPYYYSGMLSLCIDVKDS